MVKTFTTLKEILHTCFFRTYWLWLIKMLYNSLENQTDKKHENNNVACVYVGERDTKKEEEKHSD